MVMMLYQMNDPSGTYFRANHTAFIIAEYLLDNECSDVLPLIGNIFWFFRAWSEVRGLIGEIPSLGFHPATYPKLLNLEEHISDIDTEATMSIQAVHVPSDYFTDHSVVCTFSHLLTSIVLSHKMVIYSFYTVIDHLQPSPKMDTSRIIFWLKKSCRCSHNIQNLRILYLGLVWYNFRRRIVMRSPALVGWRVTSKSRSSPPSISQALKANLSASWMLSKAANGSCAMNSKTTRR
jgi:F0F1-type ATP synthase beta subunit